MRVTRDLFDCIWRCSGLFYAIAALKTIYMSDIDFVRITAMLILPKCLESSTDPVKDAVDYAQELLIECQKRENL